MDKITKNDWTCLTGRQVVRPLFLLFAIGLLITYSAQAQKSYSEPFPRQESTEKSGILNEPNVRSPLNSEQSSAGMVRGGWFLQIDSINLNVPLGTTTLGKNRELLVPANAKKAAYYLNGPKPGNPGTALITGHLDANGGAPGVFINLRNIKPNDEIQVRRDDGSIAIFKIDKSEVYRQDSTFPWKEVYRASGDPGLRIITCHGTYNPKTGRYSHNLVVFASLIKISN